MRVSLPNMHPVSDYPRLGFFYTAIILGAPLCPPACCLAWTAMCLSAPLSKKHQVCSSSRLSQSNCSSLFPDVTSSCCAKNRKKNVIHWPPHCISNVKPSNNQSEQRIAINSLVLVFLFWVDFLVCSGLLVQFVRSMLECVLCVYSGVSRLLLLAKDMHVRLIGISRLPAWHITGTGCWLSDSLIPGWVVVDNAKM